MFPCQIPCIISCLPDWRGRGLSFDWMIFVALGGMPGVWSAHGFISPVGSIWEREKDGERRKQVNFWTAAQLMAYTGHQAPLQLQQWDMVDGYVNAAMIMTKEKSQWHVLDIHLKHNNTWPQIKKCLQTNGCRNEIKRRQTTDSLRQYSWQSDIPFKAVLSAMHKE